MRNYFLMDTQTQLSKVQASAISINDGVASVFVSIASHFHMAFPCPSTCNIMITLH